MTYLNDQETLLRIREVQQITGLNRNLIYSLPDFPGPVKISTRSSAWVASEVQRWIHTRVEQRGSV
jgi:prophage regulatory protein